MKTREIFKLLREVVEPPLADLGFAHVKDSSGVFLIWSRPLKAKRFETVGCQIDKWGWDPWVGTKFTLLMNRSSRRGNVALCKSFATLAELLTPDEKRAAQDLQNAVIARFRVPGETEFNAHKGYAAYSEYLIRDYRAACAPENLSGSLRTGLWLRVLDANDVRAWGNFLADWVPRVLERDANADWNFGWGG
jgi:hypothetical protein